MWLKVLNLSHSKNLTQTPDFIGLPRLERLILKDCPRLHELHHSIGVLRNLILLNLKDCTGLRYLPKEIRKFKSLKSLILSGCSKILLMETDMVQMKSLITLVAENKPTKQVPFSIVNSESIGYISLHQFQKLKVEHCTSELQLPYLFTKAFRTERLRWLKDVVGTVNIKTNQFDLRRSVRK